MEQHFHGEEITVNLSELEKLKNLKSLTLQNYKLDARFIELLNHFHALNSIYFSMCEFESDQQLRNLGLDRIILDNCSFKSLEQFEPSRIFQVSNFDRKLELEALKKSDRLELLNLQNCKLIKGLEHIEEFRNIKELNLDGSHIDSPSVLGKLKSRMIISHEDNSLPIR